MDKRRFTRKIDHSWEIGELFLFVPFMFDPVAIHEKEIRDDNGTSINHLTMNSEKQRMQRLKSCE